MIVKVEDKNKRKLVFDILSIFYPRQEIIFDNENPEIIVKDDFLILKDKKTYYKNKLELKQIIYKYLEKKTAYSNAWGLLTGSKPSKLLQKQNRQEIKEKYLISDKKLEILEKVKKNQDKLSFKKENFNLYINIPFCPTRCTYCSYPTIVGDRQDKSLYVDYLIKELDNINLQRDLDTIYIGGGTPSFLKNDQIERLLEKINEKFTYKEFSFEAGREDSLDREKLDTLKKYGVDRICVNPQTFTKKVIEKTGRIQDTNKLINIYKYARGLGFIVNMDFIVGLFGESRQTFKENFKILKQLDPQNITFHALAQKVGSKYFEENINGSKEEALKISEDIFNFTNENSYQPYYLYRQKNIISNLENIGYCKKDTASRYNILINEELENVVGLGMNANSKLMDGQKYRNSKNLRDYMKNIDSLIKDKNLILQQFKI